MSRQRRDPTAKSSVTVALVLHGIAFVVLFVWAAKSGKLDPVFKRFDVVLQAKKPEPPKKEPEQPKPQEPKPAAPVPPPVQQPKAAPPPVVKMAPPAANPAPAVTAVAPPAATLAAFDFNDGAKVVETSTNAPVLFYKNALEYAFRSNWERPGGDHDDQYVAEVEVFLDGRGTVTRHTWKKSSGDKVWDDSVRQAILATKSLNRAPPPGFPGSFVVRFDVLPATESLLK